ncbi:7-cyano-7-deazaguanine synthase [Virgibacillus natechei]|uniref:7-cyano-7-deazaguanine synthase n=1 Tax=Virgibacillus natechei TaxID=1216297 RepID=A0ABS4IJT6_9BACI|nr:7-cyano-7-deazaguanine synthase QueC [Virgibacillus natechei]MBP1971123.1 7-cyano-7-deazaguanine synthase [Virgibacillus natechei]UZD12191.1 7-cyano-7-deazaguanine synthase QueC [Virgibacillus natechei]
MDNKKAVVVFSGGQDSTTCLFWALEKFDHVEAVTFQYGQRHIAELDCAREICETLGVKQHELDMSLLNQLAPNALTRDDMEITEGDGLPSTFVPGRNLLFLSFAGVLAKQIDAKHVITGVSEADFSGYPDCRDDFIKSMNVTLNLSMDDKFVIHTPLMWLDKSQVWELSDQLDAFEFVKSRTLTCYNGVIDSGCGDCPSCNLRSRGLENYEKKKAGVTAE